MRAGQDLKSQNIISHLLEPVRQQVHKFLQNIRVPSVDKFPYEANVKLRRH